MALPISPKLDFKGGSSEATSGATSNARGSSDGGTRAPIFNIATGKSSLSAATGNSTDWRQFAALGAAIVAGLWLTRRK